MHTSLLRPMLNESQCSKIVSSVRITSTVVTDESSTKLLSLSVIQSDFSV